MNRRSYFKNLFVIAGTVGVTSIPILKWLNANNKLTQINFAEKEDLLAALVELIIPATDSPSAKDADVHLYIIRVLSKCFDSKQQLRFLSGLNDLESYALQHYKRKFLECNMKDKHDILTFFDKNTGYSIQILNKIDNKIFGTPFYYLLKQLTVEGYCCSQIGATQGLSYDYIPVYHEACLPLLNNQKSWATK